MHLSIDDTVTQWLGRLRSGDENATRQVWERYFSRLCKLARGKLPANVRREFDEEDIALSAIDCLYRGVRDGRFPDLDDRNGLWSLLVVLTARKVSHRLRDRAALKRGGGRVVGEFPAGDTRGSLFDSVIGQEPTPEFSLQVAEEADLLLRQLPDEGIRQTAELKMEGYTNDEVAKTLQCGKRTVERRLMIIRKIWSQTVDGVTADPDSPANE